ncbi:hypothetical protein CTI12_AA405720 [Artemisia annua]|uniref:KIB1-4 beta-propeller domain-containing protein n=1 Tax=Artemisia annua TaxID=35608 RepID=A0A2U1M994_ARTAN|nr:hypothetical protein CTI12_AA405720 [Artemisia annua]
MNSPTHHHSRNITTVTNSPPRQLSLPPPSPDLTTSKSPPELRFSHFDDSSMVLMVLLDLHKTLFKIRKNTETNIVAAAAVHSDYSNGPPSRFPSLLLAEKEKDGQEFRELFLLSNKSIRKIRLPEAYGKVCRSSYGWLVTIGYDHAIQLINPLSRETINLPKLDTFPGFLKNSRWHEGIKKLLIVTNNPSSLKLPLDVVFWGIFRTMGFWCPRDKKWIAVGQYREACDVYGENPTALVYVSRLPTDKAKNKGIAYITGLDEGERKRLLVVVRRRGMVDGYFSMETYTTKRFLLFAYDLEDGRWSTVNDLGRKTLLVGHSSSFWIEDATGVIKRNGIYYTDDADFLYYATKNGGGGDMGIYHLSDETIKPHFTGESRSFVTPPIWLESIYF